MRSERNPSFLFPPQPGLVQSHPHALMLFHLGASPRATTKAIQIFDTSLHSSTASARNSSIRLACRASSSTICACGGARWHLLARDARARGRRSRMRAHELIATISPSSLQSIFFLDSEWLFFHWLVDLASHLVLVDGPCLEAWGTVGPKTSGAF